MTNEVDLKVELLFICKKSSIHENTSNCYNGNLESIQKVNNNMFEMLHIRVSVSVLSITYNKKYSKSPHFLDRLLVMKTLTM